MRPDGSTYDFRISYSCERTYDGGVRGGREYGGPRENQGGSTRGDEGELQRNRGEQNTQNLNAGESCPVKGNPVILSTGNKIESEVDFGTAGEMALHLKRTYNQFTDAVGLFGYNWISSFDYRLSFGGSSTFSGCYARPSIAECGTGHTEDEIFAHRTDGRIIKFTRDAATGIYWENKPDPISKIVRQPNGSWLVTFEDNFSELYTQGGYPLWVQDEHGLRWTYSYGGMNNTQVQRVTHSNGRYVQFIWVDDELREVRDPAGTQYSFAYTNQKVSDGFHTLKTTTYPGAESAVTTYHYGGEAGEPDYSFAALTGKSYNGIRYSRFTYDAAQRTAGTEHAGGVESNTFTYAVPTPDELSVTHTNPLGKQAVYDFKNGQLMTVTGQASANCPATGRGNSYDDHGYPELVTDENGNVRSYDYNAKGQLLKKTEALGTPDARTTTYTWDSASNRIARVVVDGLNQADYTFTEDNRLASVRVVNLSGNGVTNQARITTYSYSKHANGVLATKVVDGPLPNDTVTSTYNQAGDLLTVENGLGHITTYSDYNALGQPGRVTDPNGATTEYAYDVRGRIREASAIVDGVAQTTGYTYDAVGRPETITTPDNVTATREYDAAGRVLREHRPEAGGTFAVKKYTYNNASQVTSVAVQRTTAVSKPSGTPILSISGSGVGGNYTVAWSGASGVENHVLEEQFNSGSWSSSNEGLSTSKAFSGKPAGTYTYRVRACNAEGCTSLSAEQDVQALHPPASAPTVVSPATDNDGAFTVGWSSVSTANQYRLEQRQGSGNWSQIYSGAGLSKAVASLANGTYDYRARACNVDGCSGYSAIDTTVVTHPPGNAPAVTTPTADNNGAFSVGWSSVSTATSYRLEQRKNGGSWSQIYSGTGRSKAVSGLGNGSYAYRARACNTGGCGAYSAIKTTVVTFPPNSAPSLSAPANADTYESFTVSWTAVSTATRYELQSSLYGGSWSTVYNSSATYVSRSHNHDGNYSYRVRACNVGGCGPFSAAKTVRVADVAGGGPCYEGVCPEPKSIGPVEEEM